MKNKVGLVGFFLVCIVVFSGCEKRLVTSNKTQIKSVENGESSIVSSLQKICPAGFILVPGNSNYGTSDFCVMKYDAKCALSSNVSQGLEPKKDSDCSGMQEGKYEGVYKNNGQGCLCRGDRQVVSTSSGFPLTFIAMEDSSQDNAKKYCQNQGWHLMTNFEWMTIARNIEQERDNWCDKDGTNCGFAPGTRGKILANGHNDSANEADASVSSIGALIASDDDNQACFGTTIDGSNRCGGKSSQKRTLKLNNGNIIWDFAGNVWHWVDATIARKDQPLSKTGNTFDFGWKWSDFTSGVLSTVIMDNGKEPDLGYDAFRPSDSTWNSGNGVGRIYHFSEKNDTNTTRYGFIRGGNWRHGYDSGAFCIHLSPVPNKNNIDDVGFRCVAFPELK